MDKLKGFGGRAAGVGAMLGTALTMVVFMAGAASATPPPDPVTEGFTDAGTKVTLYGGAMVALVLIGLLIFLGVKYLRRGVRSA